MTRRVALGAIAFVLSLYAAGGTGLAQRLEQSLPASVGDLATVQLLEVRDNAGQVLLNGTFVTNKNTPKETERKAELKSPTGQPSKGKAEVEIERKDGVVKKDEIEVTVEKLPAMTTLGVFLDGQSVTTFMTSKKGKAVLKLERKPTS